MAEGCGWLEFDEDDEDEVEPLEGDGGGSIWL
jgi:hypothetical protein